jgi:hypothetical protein
VRTFDLIIIGTGSATIAGLIARQRVAIERFPEQVDCIAGFSPSVDGAIDAKFLV